MSKEKMEILEELIRGKVNQANAIKESMKPIEAFGTATKEICKKIKEIIDPKKLEILEMLSKGRMQGEAYRYMTETLSAITEVIDVAFQDSEKMYFAKQQELNFLANEYSKLREIHGKIVAELNKEVEESKAHEKIEKTNNQPEVKAVAATEYIRPDQNPNTKIGRASMELQKRRNSNKSNDE